MKPYYADFANHMLRYYFLTKGERPQEYRTEADRLNWEACHQVLSTYDDFDRTIISSVYNSGCPIIEAVAVVSAQRTLAVTHIWYLLNDCNKQLAKVRGLI